MYIYKLKCEIFPFGDEMSGMFSVLTHSSLQRDVLTPFPGGCSALLQLEMFSQQLLHTRDQIDFTACGLFPLDMTLLHSVVAAVTTYIIILVQFQNK
jgi:hypothetical protein